MQRKEQNTRLQRALYQEKRHYKMFKAGKIWTAVGISLLFGGGFALAQPVSSVHAATAETAPASSTLATIQSQTVTSLTGQLPKVTLASGWSAPTWTAEDFNIEAVAGKPGTYTATLSTQGLAALQAANAGAKVTAQNVQSGTLTVENADAKKTATTTTAQDTGAAADDRQASADTSAVVATKQAQPTATQTAVKQAQTNDTTAAQTTAKQAASTSATASAATEQTQATATAATTQNGTKQAQPASPTATTKQETNATTAPQTTAKHAIADDETAAKTTTKQDMTTATTSQVDISQTPTVTTPTTKLNETTAVTPAVTALGGEATQADIEKAKTAAEAALKATGQPQIITAMSTESTGTATITSSTDKIGYGSGVSGSFTLTVNMTVEAGDKVTFTLPTTPTKQFVNGVFSLSTLQDFGSAAVGTVEKVTNPDGTITVTDTMKQAGTYTQDVTLSLQDNYAGQALLVVGDTKYTVDVYVNNNKTGSTSFTQTVDPQAFLDTPTQTHPNTSVAGLLPNTDYVWEVAVNESDGVYDQQNQSLRVNSAVNYGTKITVPVPAGFVLNQDLTNQINKFSPGSAYNTGNTDTTTITQVGGAGGNVIIKVPKGSGSQYYDGDPAYRIAGHFDTTQVATDTTLIATGPVTMVQQIDDKGTTKTYTADPWKSVILGTGSNQGANLVTVANGNNGADAKQLILDQDLSDDPATVLQYSFQYHAAAASNAVAIRMTVPDGLQVNKIEVPEAGASNSLYMPGTTSYGYVLTLVDGSTENGTVAPGGTVTSKGNIRTAVFTPDSLAPGATSGIFKFDG
ncbi:MBG domain-containing protein [Lacticaseibacillus sp. GG6-2]